MQRSALILSLLVLLMQPLPLRAATEVFYQFNLDQDPGWQRTGSWQFGPPGGTGKAGDDPKTAHTGQNVFGTVLSGDYPHNIENPHTLITPPFDLSDAKDTTLSFYRAISVEANRYDHAHLHISTNGSTWIPLWSNPALFTYDPQWTKVTYDIAPIADRKKKLYIRWSLGPTDHNVAYGGWNIDDIQISAERIDPLEYAPKGSLLLQIYEAEPHTTATFTYTLQNTGENALPWGLIQIPPWLQAQPAAGALPPQGAAQITIETLPSIQNLPAADYHATIAFLNQNTGFQRILPVALQVWPPPAEIQLTDSLPPEDDHALAFGQVLMGLPQVETLTFSNTHPRNDLLITHIYQGGLIEEDFSGSAQAWQPADPERWTILDEQYRADQSGTNRMLQSLLADLNLGDGFIQATFTREGADQNVAGILFRASPDTNIHIQTGLAWFVSISGNQQFYVARLRQGDFRFLTGWRVSPALRPSPEPNRIAVNVKEKHIQIYFNEQLAWQGADPLLPEKGRVGLLAWGGFPRRTIHYMDDFLFGHPLPEPPEIDNTGQTLSPKSPQPDRQAIRQAPNRPLNPGTRKSARTTTQTFVIPPTGFQLNDLPQMPIRIAPGGATLIQVSADPKATGHNEATLWVQSNDPENVRLPVALSMQGARDSLDVAPYTPEVLTAHLGGPFTDSRIVYRIDNLGDQTLQWSIEALPDWLLTDADTGGLEPGASTSFTLTIAPEVETFLPDTYLTSFTVRNQQTGYAEHRDLSLTIFESPEIQLTPERLEATLYPGEMTTLSLVVANQPDSERPLNVETSRRETGRTLPPAPPGRLRAAVLPTGPIDRDAPKQATQNGEASAIPDQEDILVRFDPGLSNEARQALLDTMGNLEVIREYPLVPGLCLIQAPPRRKAQIKSALVRETGVQYAEDNGTYKAQGTFPNDPAFPLQWGLHESDPLVPSVDPDIDAPEAWRLRNTGDTIVAVIDSGVDLAHEDLKETLWINEGEIPGNGLDDDGNGFIDDMHGYDFYAENASPTDPFGHGTHCAGIVSAVGNNGIGISGVAWRLPIMALRFLGPGGTGTTADAIECIDYAVANGARVLSCSWGGTENSEALRDAIFAAGQAGVLVVIAAGNASANTDVTPFFPSAYDLDNILSVLATNRANQRASFSNYGAISVDIGAPGEYIYSTIPGDEYDYLSGTSMATPMVSAAAALLFTSEPGLNVLEVRQLLMQTAIPVSDLEGQCITGGRLNLLAALQRTEAKWIRNKPSNAENIQPGEAISMQVGLDASALDPGLYNGELLFETNHFNQPLNELPVQLRVLQSPLDLTPYETPTITGPLGGPFDVQPIIWQINNVGQVAHRWSIHYAAQWIDVAPASGTLSAGESRTITATPRLDRWNALGQGSHTIDVLLRDEISSQTLLRQINIEVLPPAQQALYFFPMDQRPDWQTEGGWAFGLPRGQAGDPDFAKTGQNVVGYNLAGPYPNAMQQSQNLTAGPFDLTGYQDIQIQYERWLRVEAAPFDSASLQYSLDQTTWNSLWKNPETDLLDSEWARQTISLPATVQDVPALWVRWTMGPTDTTVSHGGWNLDDVRITGRLIDPLIVHPPQPYQALGKEAGPFEPASQTYVLSNPSTSTIQWAVETDAPWLTFSLSAGWLAPGDTQTIDAAITNAAALPAGEYAAHIRFANQTSRAVIERQAQLLVIAPPEWNITPSAFDILARAGSFTTRDLTIQNTPQAEGPLSFTITPRSIDPPDPALPYILVNPHTSETLQVGQARQAEVTFNAIQLERGSYQAQINILTNHPLQQPNPIPISLRVIQDDLDVTSPESPECLFDPKNLTCVPGTLLYMLHNYGTLPISFNVQTSAPWLRVEIPQGTILPGEKTPIPITPLPKEARVLPPGSHHATIHFQNTQTNTTLNENLTIRIPDTRKTFYAFPLDENPEWKTEGLWEWGIPQGKGTAPDPQKPPTGENIYGYNLHGDYTHYMPPLALQTPTIDCSRIASATLRFQSWLTVERALYDQAGIEVSNNGIEWTQIYQNPLSYSLVPQEWETVEYDISHIADYQPNLQIRWVMGPTDVAIRYGGWNIDDIEIRGHPAQPLPRNDLFQNAFHLKGYQGQYPVFNARATEETGEPHHAGLPPHASLWWKIQPDRVADATFRITNNSFDTLLAAYEGETLHTLIPIVANDDATPSGASQITFQTEPGKTYYIALDGYKTSVGAATLQWHIPRKGQAEKWLSHFSASDNSSPSIIRYVQDVNADNMADIVVFQNDVKVALSKGYALFPPATWTRQFGTRENWNHQRHIRTLADINNDKAADIIAFGEDAIYTALSTGHAFAPAQTALAELCIQQGWNSQTHHRTIADINNDGAADIIAFGIDHTRVAIATGDGRYHPSTVWTLEYAANNGWNQKEYPRYIADADGDQWKDIIGFARDGVLVALAADADGNGQPDHFKNASTWSPGFGARYGWTSRHVRAITDLNADQQADIAAYGDAGLFIALSNGSAFDTPLFAQPFGGYLDNFEVHKNPRFFPRVNHDRQHDALAFSDRLVYAAISQNGTLETFQPFVEDFTCDLGWKPEIHPRFIADMNSDGKDDIIGFWEDGTYVYLNDPEPMTQADLWPLYK